MLNVNKKKKIIYAIIMLTKQLWLFIKVAVWKNRFNWLNSKSGVEFEKNLCVMFGTKKEENKR